jgi:hypothetical protein
VLKAGVAPLRVNALIEPIDEDPAKSKVTVTLPFTGSYGAGVPISPTVETQDAKFEKLKSYVYWAGAARADAAPDRRANFKLNRAKRFDRFMMYPFFYYKRDERGPTRARSIFFVSVAEDLLVGILD